MGSSDELSDEERAIMFFLKRYFEAAEMPNALWVFNESENMSEIGAILDGYRDYTGRRERIDCWRVI